MVQLIYRCEDMGKFKKHYESNYEFIFIMPKSFELLCATEFSSSLHKSDTLMSSNAKYLSINYEGYSHIGYICNNNSFKQTNHNLILKNVKLYRYVTECAVVLPYFINVWSRNPWLSSTTVSRTTSLRFPKRCHIFLGVRKQFCLKTDVYKHSDTFTKAGRSHGGKTENTAVVFFLALSSYLPFYTQRKHVSVI